MSNNVDFIVISTSIIVILGGLIYFSVLIDNCKRLP